MPTLGHLPVVGPIFEKVADAFSSVPVVGAIFGCLFGSGRTANNNANYQANNANANASANNANGNARAKANNANVKANNAKAKANLINAQANTRSSNVR
jgi:TctA family transporter